MTELVFSKSERKQIALRFKTLYQIVTDKTWTTGEMGVVTHSEIIKTTYQRDDLRKMGKGGKAPVPDGLMMCLAGAAAYVNGPTEEEIVALLATQIVLSNNLYGLEEDIAEWMDGMGGKYAALDRSRASIALVLFEHFCLPEGNGMNVCSGGALYNDAVDQIINFNDDLGGDNVTPVRKIIRDAQKLYDKLWKVWLVEQKHAAIMAQRTRDFAKLKL
jgi:hypothetical protein